MEYMWNCQCCPPPVHPFAEEISALLKRIPSWLCNTGRYEAYLLWNPHNSYLILNRPNGMMQMKKKLCVSDWWISVSYEWLTTQLHQVKYASTGIFRFCLSLGFWSSDECLVCVGPSGTVSKSSLAQKNTSPHSETLFLPVFTKAAQMF